MEHFKFISVLDSCWIKEGQIQCADMSSQMDLAKAIFALLDLCSSCVHLCTQVSGTEWEPWLEDCDGNGSSRRDRAQFVATQMILPTASGLTGCTVLGYYQHLLQKASEYVAESADQSKTSRSFTAPLLLISDPSPNSTVSDAPLYPSGLLSQSLFR